MAANPNDAVPAVYRWIIDEVVAKVNAEFTKLGLDDSVLHELKQTWETKLIQSDCATFQAPLYNIDSINAANPHLSIPEPQTTLVKEEPVDYNFMNENDAFFQQLAQQIAQQSNSSTSNNSSNPFRMMNNSQGNLNAGQLLNQNMFRLPQLDGAVDVPDLKLITEPELKREDLDRRLLSLSRKIQQTDGPNDDDDDDDDDEENEAEIGSDLDDEESDEDEQEADHLILCQYEKVSRIKNKWKCVLKDGIVNVNGKDYLFSKANCDFEW
ncbi:hypothetical protein HK098_004468 [Nowakowskiella sp. JEL0407]|nr:hypothetical protein HK098_004468 [Nowakowskiella sp. JEL0407]